MNIPFSDYDLKTGVKLPKLDDELLAYETGVHVGDGSLQMVEGGTNSTRYFGDAVNDWLFYNQFMPKVVKKLYNKEVSPTKRTDAQTCTLSVCSKAIAHFKLSAVGLPKGNKNQMLGIPSIVKSDEALLINFLRGVADTDFSLFFHKKGGKYGDPEINCTMANKKIIKDLETAFKNLGFSLSMRYDVQRTRKGKTHTEHVLKICGGKQLNKWMEVIGFDNPKHKTKFVVWDKLGFCLPRQTTYQRLALISSF